MAKTAKTKTITVKVNEENPEPLEVLAQAVIDVADGFERMKKSKLSQRAVILLLKDICGVNYTDILKVLEAGEKLKRTYIKDIK